MMMKTGTAASIQSSGEGIGVTMRQHHENYGKDLEHVHARQPAVTCVTSTPPTTYTFINKRSRLHLSHPAYSALPCSPAASLRTVLSSVRRGTYHPSAQAYPAAVAHRVLPGGYGTLLFRKLYAHPIL